MPITLGNLVLYSIMELSEKLGVTAVTIRSYIRQDRLCGQKMGGKWYVSEESLGRYFNNRISTPAATSPTHESH